MKAFPIVLFLLLATSTRAGNFYSDFALVMIDDQTESTLGPFPYDRQVYAAAIDACATYRAKAVVLKFFLDRPKSANGDRALRTAMQKFPVALQARIEPTEGTPQDLPLRLALSNQILPSAIRGDRGWIPLATLVDVAASVGFVDFDRPEIPLVENFHQTSYRSLILSCLEFATGQPAEVRADGKIFVGSGYLPVDARNVFHADLDRPKPLQVISLSRLLAGQVKPEEIEGRVVIMGWNSRRTPTIETPYGKLPLHHYFVECLENCYRTLQANQ